MLFNSVDFALFLPVVFLLYWYPARSSHRLQNLLLVVASYVFYGWWDWRFLSLIVASSATDYWAGQAIHRAASRGGKKTWLLLSVAVNLGLLGTFKYYDFFVDSLADALAAFGVQPNVPTLRLILPVGISFYTFQTLSYTIDISRGRVTPTRDWVAFFAFVSFFPQLVAGPIERATRLLPQFLRPRRFDAALARDGLRQALWGLFKKVAIADVCAVHADAIFADLHQQPASALALGTVYFACQIYADFSGYSDVAIGTARLFGFDLMRNFAFPYFSRDIAEFWRRWHVSLSSWFRDYVYIPLGGSRGSRWNTVRNVLLVFGISGLWHGANWTFLIWGLLNGLYFLPLFLLGRNRRNLGPVAEGRLLPTLAELRGMAGTFGLTCLAWIFFRAPDVHSALEYLRLLPSVTLLAMPGHLGSLPTVALFLVWEWLARERQHGLSIGSWPTPARWAVYLVVAYWILVCGDAEKPFIYFQF